MAPLDPSKAKSTVRQGKKSVLSSTQRFLPIAEIHHNTVVLKNGGLRGIILVEALNFNLKSETEQQGIIAGYQSFVNTLSFPIQVSVRSSKMNITPYLQQLRGLGNKQQNELLRQQTLSYADFIEKLVDVADIMQKRFYVIVPLDVNVRGKTLLEQFLGWISPDDSSAKVAQRHREFAASEKILRDRLNLVETGLENTGLSTRRMTTRELVELFYQIYNPKTSMDEKLPTEKNLRTDADTL